MSPALCPSSYDEFYSVPKHTLLSLTSDPLLMLFPQPGTLVPSLFH